MIMFNGKLRPKIEKCDNNQTSKQLEKVIFEIFEVI